MAEHKSHKHGHEESLDLMHPDAEHIKKHVRAYLIVGATLLVLTIVTVVVSYIHFGAEDSNVGNITVALVIATIKAGLVAAIFMHLAAEKWEIYRVLLATLFFVLSLFLLTLLAYSDFIRIR
jgi:caa(3)-type oxidase subunit IV